MCDATRTWRSISAFIVGFIKFDTCYGALVWLLTGQLESGDTVSGVANKCDRRC